MKTEAWLRRKIELKEQAVQLIQEDIGDLKRELAIHLGRDVNQQQNYGGNIEPKGIKAIYVDPRFDWSVNGDGQTLVNPLGGERDRKW
jgi:hypothetical protein